MKTNSIIFFSLILSLCALIALAGCGKRPDPVVYVATAAEDANVSEYSYYAVFNSRKAKQVDAFLPDTIERYDAFHENFVSEIKNGSVVNRLFDKTVTDEAGKAVPADPVFSDILEAAATTIKHDIIQFDILKDGACYFAVVKLNVNWQSPCDLYRYDDESNTLIRLHSWDSVDIVGIALPD